MKRGPEHYAEAYQSLLHLRGLPLLAAKELFYIHSQIQVERRLLSQKGHDPERQPDDREGPRKGHHENPQSLRKRKGRYVHEVHEADKTYGNSVETNEKRIENLNGGVSASSEDDNNQPKRSVPNHRSLRLLIRSRGYLKQLWRRPTIPQSRSINYWQKLGQLFTNRRIRRVCRAELRSPMFANRRIGHYFSGGVHDISTAMWCERVNVL
jgi:hypothetical protein